LLIVALPIGKEYTCIQPGLFFEKLFVFAFKEIFFRTAGISAALPIVTGSKKKFSVFSHLFLHTLKNNKPFPWAK
jgi:hypothetical protein